jgi:hypothetical protein
MTSGAAINFASFSVMTFSVSVVVNPTTSTSFSSGIPIFSVWSNHGRADGRLWLFPDGYLKHISRTDTVLIGCRIRGRFEALLRLGRQRLRLCRYSRRLFCAGVYIFECFLYYRGRPPGRNSILLDLGRLQPETGGVLDITYKFFWQGCYRRSAQATTRPAKQDEGGLDPTGV